MCQFFSGIITREKTVWDYDNDSREFLIEKGNLEDLSKSPDFVWVELIPRDGDVFNHNLKNWYLKIDQDFKPDWFSDEFAAKEMKKAIKQVFKKRFFVDLDEWHIVENKRVFVKNSSVKARENSSVVAWGNSSVKAWENSSVAVCSDSVKIKKISDLAIIRDFSGDTPKIIIPKGVKVVRK